MAKYRKLGRTSSQRKALIRNQVTALLNNGKIVTTEAKAKEIRKVAEGLIAKAVKEKDNYEEIKEALNPGDYNMIVTPKEIDDLINNMKEIVAMRNKLCIIKIN